MTDSKQEFINLLKSKNYQHKLGKSGVTVTPAQPSKDVRKQADDYRVTAGFYWPAFAALVFIFIAAMIALLHFDPIGKLAAHRFEVQNGID